MNNFNFWCPVEISKAIDQETGEELMLLGGIASTADEDSDGEFLDPKGFDIKPLIESGMVNWHHQAKTCPATIVGEPLKAEIKKEGLYIETKLYPSSQVARDIWELAKTLDKDSTTRRLGYSIEGKVLERKSENRNSPDYKKITKAIITGVAITHQPKNPKTFANIIKGEIGDDVIDDEETNKTSENEEKYYEEVGIKQKSLDTDSGRPLIKEDVDEKLKVVTFGKSEIIEKIFADIPGISIEKAKKIYTLIKNISKMAKRRIVTEEDILKAYDALGLEPDVTLVKADDSDEDDEEVEEVEDDEEVEKAEEDDEEDEESDNEEEEDDEEDDEEDEPTPIKKGNIFQRFERIEKAIATSHVHNSTYIKALGVMIKDCSQALEKANRVIEMSNSKIEELTEINKAQTDTIKDLRENLEAFGDYTPAPKSMRSTAKPIERSFSKGNDDELNKGKNEINILNKSAVIEILDQATFANNGYDDEFSKACLDFEASGNLSDNVISRIKREYGINIVK
jgi:hypothetical protein